MSKTKELTLAPHTWGELTREQLIHIHSIEQHNLSNIEYKILVFLYLNGLSLCGESFFSPFKPQETSDDLGDRIAEEQRRLDYIQSCLNGDAEITVVLQPTNNNNEHYSTSLWHMLCAVRECTKFLDEPFELLDSKLGDVELEYSPTPKSDKRIVLLRCPAVMMSDISYEQYQNAQSSLQMYWNRLDNMNGQMKKWRITEAELRNPSSTTNEHIAELTNLSEEIKVMQCDFLSHLCILDKPKSASRIITARNKLGIKRTVTERHTEHCFNYLSTEAEQTSAILQQCAPPYLFPIIYQQFQSSLLAFKSRFPDLFGKSSGKGSDRDQFVSMLNTVNTVMKEQGYTNQQAVFDTNAVFVFEALDSMIKHGKEMEKLSKQSKIKK